MRSRGAGAYRRDVEDAVPYGCAAVGWAHNCGRGKPLPYGGGQTCVRIVPRDVEDAVPYGCAAVGWAHNCGRGKPLPYGGGYARVRNVQRDVGDAVPYGCAAVGWAHNRGRGKPLPYGGGQTCMRIVPRDVEDAVPYGVVQISGVVRKPREGQAPPLRRRTDLCANRAAGRRGRRPLRMRSRFMRIRETLFRRGGGGPPQVWLWAGRGSCGWSPARGSSRRPAR